MNWVEFRDHAWRSDCGRYEVDGVVLCDERGPRRYYEVRRTRQHQEGPHLVSTCVPTANLAKDYAEQDASE
jgi:hypothetical protein